VNFDEAVLVHVLSVQLADTRLKSEDSLVSGDSQVDDSVVESHVLLDTRELLVFLLTRLLLLFLLLLDLLRSGVAFMSLVHNNSACVSYLERKDWYRGSNNKALLDMEFNLDGAVFDGTWGLDNLSDNFKDRFGSNTSRKIFHLFASGLLEDNALNSLVYFTHHDEARLTLSANVLSTASNSD